MHEIINKIKPKEHRKAISEMEGWVNLFWQTIPGGRWVYITLPRRKFKSLIESEETERTSIQKDTEKFSASPISQHLSKQNS